MAGSGKGLSALNMLELNKLAPTAFLAICSIFSASSVVCDMTDSYV